MKLFLSFLALIALVIGCEFQNINSAPDKQYVSVDERAQIDGWSASQNVKMSTEEYEIANPDQFLSVESTYRQSAGGKWVIEGSLKNFASTINYQNVQLTISYYGNSHVLLGSENHMVNEILSPGDRGGFYFKTDGIAGAHTLQVEVNKALPVEN